MQPQIDYLVDKVFDRGRAQAELLSEKRFKAIYTSAGNDHPRSRSIHFEIESESTTSTTVHTDNSELGSKNSMDMSRVFGLETSHLAQNIVYRQNYYKTKPSYISEYDLILLVRNCFAHGFNPRCLLSFSTIKLNPIWTSKLLKDELREGMLAKLLIE